MSLLPLITQNTGVTHVIIAAIHLNEGPGNITLNDDPFDAEKFRTLWAEAAWLRGAGIKVLGMLGGAARGSFERLGGSDEEVSCLGCLLCFGRRKRSGGGEVEDAKAMVLLSDFRSWTRLSCFPVPPSLSRFLSTSSLSPGSPPSSHTYLNPIPIQTTNSTFPQFEAYYTPLRTLLQHHHLDGLDLDIEEPVSLSIPVRLLTRLRADFGPSFLLTLAPVATALLPDPSHPAPPRHDSLAPNTPNPLHRSLPHLSGFSYAELEASPAGRLVEWYNTQFYCGWGDARSTGWYDAVVAAGWDPRRVVLGVVTNAANGTGHVGLGLLREVCGALRARYAARGGFGGVMGWEYFNAGLGEGDRDVVRAVSGAEETAVAMTTGTTTTTTTAVTTTAAAVGATPPAGPAGWAKALSLVLRAETPPAPSASAPPLLSPTAVVAALAQPAVPWPGRDVDALVALGFSRHEAVAALNATNGHVELAAGLLFER